MYKILSLKKIMRWKLKIQNKIITRLDVSYLISGMEANKTKNKVSQAEHTIFNKDFVFDKLYLGQLKFENILVLIRPNLVDRAECVAGFSQKSHGSVVIIAFFVEAHVIANTLELWIWNVQRTVQAYPRTKQTSGMESCAAIVNSR